MHDKLHLEPHFLMMADDGIQIMIVPVIHLPKNGNVQVNIEVQHVMVIHKLLIKKAHM